MRSRGRALFCCPQLILLSQQSPRIVEGSGDWAPLIPRDLCANREGDQRRLFHSKAGELTERMMTSGTRVEGYGDGSWSKVFSLLAKSHPERPQGSKEPWSEPLRLSTISLAPVLRAGKAAILIRIPPWESLGSALPICEQTKGRQEPSACFT